MPHASRLEEVLTEEIAVCESLLEAGQTARRAFDAMDPRAVQAAVRRRREQLQRLDILESEAAELRTRELSMPARLLPHATRLRDLTRDIAAEETELGRLSAAALTRLRERLKGVHAGSKGLRGYRGSGTVAPRFSDRRG